MPYKDRDKQRAFQRVRLAARRRRYLAGKICADCGEYRPERLEFDHVRGTKVSHRIWSWSTERLEAELAKCEVRCKTCHHARHASERRRHGIKRYEYDCRCEDCKAAKAKANARYRDRAAQRPGPESNGRERLCRPLDNHSPTGPGLLEGYALAELSGAEA